MSLQLRQMQDIPLLVNDILLRLTDYAITGGCLVREAGTAEGTAVVTACYPKGTRLTLKGRLTDMNTDTAKTAAALDDILHSGSACKVTIGALQCSELRLVGYALSGGEDFPVLKLVFYTQAALTEMTEWN